MSTAATRSFIDIGANLLDPCFQGRYHGGSQKHEPDLDAVLKRASTARVEKVAIPTVLSRLVIRKLLHLLLDCNFSREEYNY